MMKSKHIAILLVGFVASLTATGCQLGHVFYQPGKMESFRSQERYDVVLAADFVQDPGQPATQEKPADSDDSDKDKKDDQPASSAPSYTVPATQYQQLALVTVGIAAFGTSDVDGVGKEASESQMSTSLGVVGRAGLSAPPPIVGNAVVGRPGLQQGFALGLGPASDRNIFTSRLNAASGANGRCQELISAGFFNRDRAACEAQFRR